jgi:death-on-curing protein
MPPIKFLTVDTVKTIHRHQVIKYGGDSGTRDTNLLESAIAMPCTTFGGEYLHATIQEMAAAYLFHLVKNHPFVDGNKRTGTAAALTFLRVNDHELAATPDQLTAFVQAVAAGELDKAQVIKFFREHVKPA